MQNLSDEIVRNLKPLIGLRLSAARRAADLRNLQFGVLHRVDGGTVGEYALHIQCPWRIEGPDGIVTGRSDLWEPRDADEIVNPETWTYEEGENLQDAQLNSPLGDFDVKTRSAMNMHDRLLVESVHGDEHGGAVLQLSEGYRLVLFPAGTRGEDWRIFRPQGNEPHFVIAGGKIQPESSGAA